MPSGVLAQTVSTLDVGAGNVNYDGAAELSVYSITPRFSINRELTTVVVAATFSRFDDEGWGSRALAAVSFLTPSLHGFRAELSGRGEMNANRVITAARQIAGGVRMHFSGNSSGAWAGVGSAQVWNGAFWQGSDRVELGLWANPTRKIGTRGTVYRANYRTLANTAETHAYYQVELTVRTTQGPIEAEGSVGRRVGDVFSGTTTWSSDAALWLTRFVALAVTAGKYASDPVQRLPGGTYLTMGLRLAPVRFFVSPRVIEPPSSHMRFTATPEGKGEIRILRYFGRADGTVEVVGSFTDWQPIRLRRVTPGLWEAAILVEVGSHFFNIRIDEGAWFVPEGTTPVDDDFNGRVGLLVVPGR